VAVALGWFAEKRERGGRIGWRHERRKERRGARV
jgi:hypothetical protein